MITISSFTEMFAGKPNKKELTIKRKNQRDFKNIDEIENNEDSLQELLGQVTFKEQ